MKGTLDLGQFWPKGGSDADTSKVVLTLGADAFRFRKDAASNFRVTHAFDDATVRGRVTKKPINDKGEVVVRLQGIDEPELHYTPAALLKRAERTAQQHAKYLEWNLKYRQPFAESGTMALAAFLARAQKDPLPCVVRSYVDNPNDVFDTYARLVGEVFVKIGQAERSVNAWLVEQGLALAAFYNSMSEDEITALNGAANRAWESGAGCWGWLADKVGRLNFDLVYRGRNAAVQPDQGEVVPPEFFRRLAEWEVNRRAGMFTGNFLA